MNSQNLNNKPSIGIIGLKGLPAFGGAATVGQSIIDILYTEYNFTVYSVETHSSASGEQDKYFQKIFSKFWIKKLNIFMYYLKSSLYVVFKSKHDLIHLHHIDGAFILPILRLKYKVITTSHARPQRAEKWPWYVKFFFNINERIAILFSNEVTCVARQLKLFYDKKHKRTFHHIPNGISLVSIPSGEPLNVKDYILFAAGRIIPLKGLHLLLQALKLIQYNGKIVVLGNLDQMPAYKEKILFLSEGLDIDFLGLVKKKETVLNYLACSKFFIFPSLSENMSMMLLEAASTLTPTICSDIEENKDIFDEHEILFFKSEDVNNLKEKIEFALSNPSEMKERAKNAIMKMKDEFLWEKIAPKYSELYNSLIKKVNKTIKI